MGKLKGARKSGFERKEQFMSIVFVSVIRLSRIVYGRCFRLEKYSYQL